MGKTCTPCAIFWTIGRLERDTDGSRSWKDATHDAEWQPTRDFVDEDGTLTAAFKEYIELNGLLPNMLKRAEKLQKEG